MFFFFFFSSRRRHTRCSRDWSSDVCSSDLLRAQPLELLLDVRPLAADAFETLLVVSELLVEGLGTLGDKRRHAKDVAQRRHAKTSRKTVGALTSLRDVFA